MQKGIFTIKQNRSIAKGVYYMRLLGRHGTTRPGQFVQIALDGFYLRRPISVCDYDSDEISIIYKVVGGGTGSMSALTEGTTLDIITGLGNGYDLSACQKPLLIGGGVGVPPLYGVAKQLRQNNIPVTVLMGFNDEEDVFFLQEFRDLGCEVKISTVVQSCYSCGYVTQLVQDYSQYDYIYTCGPEPMLKAVYDCSDIPAQFSFETRMACGFGACMGCSCKTKFGTKRICKDGPVLLREEIVW